MPWTLVVGGMPDTLMMTTWMPNAGDFPLLWKSILAVRSNLEEFRKLW